MPLSHTYTHTQTETDSTASTTSKTQTEQFSETHTQQTVELEQKVQPRDDDSELLRLLRNHGRQNLPADVRTLIKRRSTVSKYQVETSELTNVGIEVSLK